MLNLYFNRLTVLLVSFVFDWWRRIWYNATKHKLTIKIWCQASWYGSNFQCEEITRLTFGALTKLQRKGKERKGKELYCLSVESFERWSTNWGNCWLKLTIEANQLKWNVGFVGEEKTGVPREKLLAAEYRATNSTILFLLLFLLLNIKASLLHRRNTAVSLEINPLFENTSFAWKYAWNQFSVLGNRVRLPQYNLALLSVHE